MTKKLSQTIICLLVTICMLAVTFTGCGNNDKQSDNYLIVQTSTAPNTIDPAAASSEADLIVIYHCMRGLFRQVEEGGVELENAESYQVSEDGCTYTFTLKDAQWSNGTPVTANDYVFAWRRAVSGQFDYSDIFASAAHIKGAAEIVAGTADPETLGVTAVDDHTLVVELDTPVPYLTALLAMGPFCPINEEFYNSLEEGMFGTSPDTYLSNGPFVLGDYIPGTACIRLDRNENYYDADEVTLDGIKFQVVSNNDVAFSTYEIGQMDVIRLNTSRLETLREDPEYADQVSMEPTAALFYLTYNIASDTSNGALGNVNLRRAIACSINRDYIVNNVLHGIGTPSFGVIPNQMVINTETGEDFEKEAIEKYGIVDADAETAQKYLELARQELGQGDIVLTLSGMNTTTQLLEAIKSMVESTLDGVTLNIQVLPPAEATTNCSNHDYDIALLGWIGDYPDPTTFLNLWLKGSSYDYGQWNNEEYTELVEKCSGEYALDYDKRWEALHEAEDILIDQQPITPIYTNQNAIMVNPRVSGIQDTTTFVADYSRVRLK